MISQNVLRRVKTFYQKNPGESLEPMIAGKTGWFHGWAYDTITDADGGAHENQLAAIVEFEDGNVHLYEYGMIQFVDKVDEVVTA